MHLRLVYCLSSLLLGSSTLLCALGKKADSCESDRAHICYPDHCCRTYCLGPENEIVNAQVGPNTCNGDWIASVTGLYWKPSEDGLELAIETLPQETFFLPKDAKFINPHFSWNFGLKLGLGFLSFCDGWDINLLWTHYHGHAHKQIDVQDDTEIISQWGAFDVDLKSGNTFWKVKLDLIDIELGREFWNSKRLSLRYFTGLRIGFVPQRFNLNFNNVVFVDTIKLENQFKGAGLRGGLNTLWHLGCGWALYSDSALNLLYGKFSTSIHEFYRDPSDPFDHIPIANVKSSFRALSFISDLEAGLQWSALLCGFENFAFTAQLGYESHLFFDQNQLFKISGLVLVQSRGDLGFQGWTLSFRYDF